MPIPNRFNTGAQALATYDFVDFAQGFGRVSLYLADIEGGTTILTSNSNLYGKEGYISVGDTASVDKDFDLVVTKPFDTGTQVSFTIAHGMTTNSSVSPSNGITIYVRKYSGSTETDLGNTDVTFRSGTFGSGTYTTPLTGVITIPRTHFGIGDILRISIVESFPDLSGAQTWYFGTDPIGRNDVGIAWGSPVTSARSTIFFPIASPNL